MKFSTDSLFVACPVYDSEIELEPWVQYESFGRIDHRIMVDPKRILLLKRIIDDKEVYFDCKTMKLVIIKDYSSSFESKSSCCQSLYLSGRPLGTLYEYGKSYFEGKNHEVQFVTPFREYVEERLGYCPEEMTLTRAKATVSVLNTSFGKEFRLSYDEDEARKEIDEKVFRKISNKQKVKKRS